jgi:hypothetical protein
MMKIVEDIKNRKVPFVTIDPSLNKLKDQNLFPEKLAKANEMLKTAKLPTKKHRS